jgi:hypothetical protein
MKIKPSSAHTPVMRTQLKGDRNYACSPSLEIASPLQPRLRSPDQRGFNGGDIPLYRFHGIDQLNEMKRQHALKLKETADDKTRLIELSPKSKKERTRKILEKVESTVRPIIQAESEAKWKEWNSKFHSNWGAEWNPDCEKPKFGYAYSDSFPPRSHMPSLWKTVHIAPYGVDFVEDIYPAEQKSPAA